MATAMIASAMAISPADADSGWGALRIWNDDEIAPNSGFPPHIHANMEIITYVREGAVSHRDSLGNADRIAGGDVHVMSADTGIQHTEFNLEPQITRIFQIWIRPRTDGGAPAWVPSRSRNRMARAASLSWRAASRPIVRRCRSARKHGCSVHVESGPNHHLRHRKQPLPLPRSSVGSVNVSQLAPVAVIAHNLTDPEEVVRRSKICEVDFLPPGSVPGA
jgi:redox-sensitive bicupin YhaK (pirin superfamily)